MTNAPESMPSEAQAITGPQTPDYDRTQSAHDAVNDLIAQQAEEHK